MKGGLIMSMSLFSLLGCVSHSDPRMNVSQKLEIPRYQVSNVEGNCELRTYSSHLVASVIVSGDFDTASRKGFRILADFIFGGNRSNTSISMTAPVSAMPTTQIQAEQVQKQGEQIAMTAPVTTRPKGDRMWEITFSMPSKYSRNTLPIPNDERIKITTKKGEEVAVIVFSGLATQSNIDEHQHKLNTWLNNEGLLSDGPYVIARYNDPFTLPWNRRNELMVKVVQ